MSYGKDPATLKAVASYRQAAHRLGKRIKPPRRATGALFRDRYRPSLVAPDTIRLVPGRYDVRIADEDGNVSTLEMPNWKCKEHYYARNKRTATCSAGPLVDFRNLREPCLGCDTFWAGFHTDANGKKKRGPMGMSDSYVFNVLHYANYHEVDQTDQQGNVKLNPSTNTPYTEWVVCDTTYGGTCKNCQTGKKTELGRMLHWPMGFGHYNILLQTQDQIGRSCATCGTRDSIDWSAWLCQNPDCGEAVFEKATTTLNMQDLQKTVVEKVRCHRCNHVDYLSEYIECRACSNPQRATLFDVDLNAMRMEVGQGEQKQTVLQISQWSDVRPIDPRFAERVKLYELEKMYAPMPIDQQAALFQLPLPASVQPQTQQQTAQPQSPAPSMDPSAAARPYGSGPGGGIYRP